MSFADIVVLSQNLGIFTWVINITNWIATGSASQGASTAVLGKTKINQIRLQCIYIAFLHTIYFFACFLNCFQTIKRGFEAFR